MYKAGDVVLLRVTTGTLARGVVRDVDPNGVLQIDVQTTITSRYRRSPEFVEPVPAAVDDDGAGAVGPVEAPTADGSAERSG